MLQNNKKLIALLLLTTVIMFGYAKIVNAGKCGPIVNPISGVSWNCVFPIRIGGLLSLGSAPVPDQDEISSPICSCPSAPIGLSVSFYEPARLIDTVSQAYCLNS